MNEEEVGNNEDLRNKALEIIGTEAADLKNYYMARKRETKRRVDKLKKTHFGCSPSKLKFSGEAKKKSANANTGEALKRVEVDPYMDR